mmetsp:Transcript_10614/g.13442  ORF Transcript_10614/g.13442 Transcript_10614/m.13442 type:complete len:257 (+) Transcript_10614:57-827(+)
MLRPRDFVRNLFLVAVLSVQPAVALASIPSSSSLELKYFNARGAAETCRIIFAIAGQQYVDTRYEITPGTMVSPEFLAAKENGDLDVNLSRAPVLVTDEGIIGQSRAIERYLSKKFGLMGSSALKEAEIDCIAEHCRDVKDAAMRKGFSFFNRDKSNEEKAAARKEWFDTDMPTMLGNIEKAISLTSRADGFAVGDENSYADISIFSLLRDCTMQADAEDTLKAAKDCKQLMAIADRIACDENVSKWLQSRPITNF